MELIKKPMYNHSQWRVAGGMSSHEPRALAHDGIASVRVASWPQSLRVFAMERESEDRTEWSDNFICYSANQSHVCFLVGVPSDSSLCRPLALVIFAARYGKNECRKDFLLSSRLIHAMTSLLLNRGVYGLTAA